MVLCTVPHEHTHEGDASGSYWKVHSLCLEILREESLGNSAEVSEAGSCNLPNLPTACSPNTCLFKYQFLMEKGVGGSNNSKNTIV